jgi:hypothetical protein
MFTHCNCDIHKANYRQPDLADNSKRRHTIFGMEDYFAKQRKAGFFSLPINRCFNLSAAMPVLAAPISGPNTRSSWTVSFEMTYYASTGDCPSGGCGSIKSAMESKVLNLLNFLSHSLVQM